MLSFFNFIVFCLVYNSTVYIFYYLFHYISFMGFHRLNLAILSQYSIIFIFISLNILLLIKIIPFYDPYFPQIPIKLFYFVFIFLII